MDSREFLQKRVEAAVAAADREELLQAKEKLRAAARAWQHQLDLRDAFDRSRAERLANRPDWIKD